MPRRLLLALLSCALLVPTLCPAADLAAPVPLDPAVTTGTLPNGLRYFVRQNAKPEQRAALWLVVGAGSVDEDDDQQGLAHLIEHMAFNGTENFPKQALVSYLESIGMQFGPEVNAYTSQNETVYMLQVPTDQPGLLDTGLRILEDWAHRVSFDEAEVDKERGVVIEEWRLGRGADERMGDAQLPVIFHGSRYGQRNTIGDPEILRNAPYETLRRFYRDWYRPDLMAVVAVGDFDPAVVEKAIRERFATMPSPEQRRPLLQPEVPDHEKTLFAITTDPEASSSGVSLLIKHEPWGESTVGDFRDGLRGGLANAMLRARLAEISRQADPPFSGAFAMDRRMARTKGAFTLRATVKEDGVARGFEALLTELERATRHGFAPGELERAKIEVLRQAEQAAAEMDKTESQRLARSLQGYFLRGTPYTDAAQRLQLVRDLLPGVTLPEVEGAAARIDGEGQPRRHRRGAAARRAGDPRRGRPHRDHDFGGRARHPCLRRCHRRGTAGAGRAGPRRDHRARTRRVAGHHHLDPGQRGTRGAEADRLQERRDPDVGHQPRRHVADPRRQPASARDGRLEHRRQQRRRRLRPPRRCRRSSRASWCACPPYISTYEEGLRGSASPQDFETLMQMTWLLATSPREDATAFKSLLERQRSFLQNRAADPEAAFRDTISVVLTGHHPRRQPPRVEDLDRLDLAASLAFYRERFADFSDFTFFLVGAIDPATAEPLVRTWLGNLPGTARRESWRDEGIKLPTGVQERVLHRGTEPKALVEMVFTARHEWSWPAEYALDSLTDVLRIRLRESIREDKSGTYGVRVGGGLTAIPYGLHQLSISWGCDPTRVTELTEAVWAQLNDIAANGPRRRDAGQGDGHSASRRRAQPQAQ
jgi:zinc protease